MAIELLLASLLSASGPMVHAAQPPGAAEADWLYFHRDQGANLEKSLAALDDLLAKHPVEAGLLWRKGRGLVRLGERQPADKAKLELYERAKALLGLAVESSPGDAEAHFWLGIAMGRYGETRGIVKSLFLVGPMRREMRTVLRLDPNHGGAHHVLGEMLMRLPAFAGGSKTAAVKEFEDAVRLSPRHAVGYLSLARAYAAVGRKEKAVEALGRLLAMKDSDDPAELADNLSEGRALLKELRP